MNSNVDGAGNLLLVAPVKVGGGPVVMMGCARFIYLFWVAKILKE